MVEECIIPLTNEGVVNYMRLSNDREVQVRVLPTQSCTQNVMFLFTSMYDLADVDGEILLINSSFFCFA